MTDGDDPRCQYCGCPMHEWKIGRIMCDDCEADMSRLYSTPVAVGNGTLRYVGRYAQPNEAPANDPGGPSAART